MLLGLDNHKIFVNIFCINAGELLWYEEPVQKAKRDDGRYVLYEKNSATVIIHLMCLEMRCPVVM